MPTQNSSPPPVVGLLAATDEAAAWQVLAVVRTELAKFALGAVEYQVNSPGDGMIHAAEASARGIRALIVGSADSALPSALSARTQLPVIRVPVGGRSGSDALPLLWPEGQTSAAAPFATVAIGEAGARNAALFVVSLLALTDEPLRRQWQEFRRAQTQAVLSAALPPA